MMRIIRKVLIGILILFAVGVVALTALALFYAKDLPDPERVLTGGFNESTKIYDRTGETLLYQIGQEKRDVIDINQIPQYVKWATIVAEDEDFYQHPGIDVSAIVRSLINDLRHGSFVQGGSTITQQFVKNALLSPEKTIPRKMKEIILSFWVEAKYSKDQILEFYLNEIPYGSNAYGIESAARTFFGKPAQDLSLEEAALLAALPQRPSYLSPHGEHVDELKARQEYILTRMARNAYVTEDEAKEAKEKELVFKDGGGSILAPHFVIHVRDYLEATYGKEVVERGGLSVITTLDWRLQEQAEVIVAEQAKVNATRHRASNAALVALDPNTGQVLSMVGSRDWFDDSVDGKVNVALRPRQPGSSFKPIVYTKLFEEGFSPDSLIFDLPTTFTTRALQSYTPRNYDNRTRGLVSIRQALAQSLNIPAVKVLHLVGIEDAIAFAEDLGITTINPSRVDLALVLGGAEVRLLDLTAAYATFASEGVHHEPAFILKIEDPKGQVLEEYEDSSKRVVDANITRILTSILSDNSARAPVFGTSNALHIPGIDVAAKTGTTTDFHDGWTMGYTPNLAIGVWAGNNANDVQIINGEGAFIAGPIWNRLMRYAVGSFPSEYGGSFTPPSEHKALDLPMVNGRLANERSVRIDKVSGKLATEFTPPSLIEERTYKEVHSLLFYVRPGDPQVPAWEAPIRGWLLSQPDSLLFTGQPPTEYDDVHTADNVPTISLFQPISGASFSQTLTVDFSVSSSLPLEQVEILINSDLVRTVSDDTSFSLDISSLSLGTHELTIKVFDKALNSAQKTVSFRKV